MKMNLFLRLLTSCSIYLISSVIVSCNHTSQINSSSGKNLGNAGLEVVQKDIPNAIVEGYIIGGSNDTLKVADVWIRKDRISCDKNGYFKKELKPGNYRILARAMNYNSFSYNLKVKKGNVYSISFNLTPYVFH